MEIKHKTKEKNWVNISAFLKTLTWSGDKSQIARKVNATLYSRFGEIHTGDIVKASDYEMEFEGVILTVERSEKDKTYTITAADYLWYTGKNKVNKSFKGTPQHITKKVCAMFGIDVGTLLSSNKIVKVTSTGDKTIYQIITEAYKKAGMTVNIYMLGKQLCTENFGKEKVAVLSTKKQISDAKYKEDITNVVNCVLILDENGKTIGKVQNSSDVKKYGVLQDVYKKSNDKKDYKKAAKELLKEIECSGSITCEIGDARCITGKAISVQRINSDIEGTFKVIADSHSYSAGKHSMTLSLDFDV